LTDCSLDKKLLKQCCLLNTRLNPSVKATK
jgi:hypothetical protein